MKKYLLKYIDNNGKILYSVSCGDHNASYALTIHQKDAQRFYGKHGIKWIEARIKADKKYHSMIKNFNYISEIEEIEEDPHWYFELCYAIEKLQKRNQNIVRENFIKLLLNEDIEKFNQKVLKRQNWENPNKMYLSDLWELGQDRLEKYYHWCQENFKPVEL